MTGFFLGGTNFDQKRASTGRSRPHKTVQNRTRQLEMAPISEVEV
jgi:hypothetical protein